MTAHPGLTGEQRQHVSELFEAAIDRPSSSWEKFIAETTGDDPTIAAELASLLDAYDRSSGFFERLSGKAVATALAAMDEPEDLWAAPGQQVLHYELMERIGGGGMGVVYKARDTRLGRVVALKFLPRRYDADAVARARLLAEARVASALDNPNIGVVYEITHTEDGRPFIAMAWYNGETLRAKARAGRVSVGDAATIGSQLASALSAAHSAGVIHRDVKPANVIITRAGIAKLVDFGIAKLQSAEVGETEALAGTIAYMSPEQTRGLALDPRTDIWSLGVLLYEIVSGQRPFRGATDAELVTSVRTDRPAALATLQPGVDADFSAIVDKCLSKDPDGRWQSASEVQQALDDWRSAKESAKAVRSKRRLLVVALVVFAGAAGAWSYFRPGTDGPRTGLIGRELTVAVLPFDAASLPDSLAYLPTGLADEVRREISRVPRFTVPSFDGTLVYATGGKRHAAMGRELAADYLVAGSVQKGDAGTRIRLTLVNGRSAALILEDSFALSHDDLPRFAREVAGKLLAELQVRVDGANRNRLSQPASVSPVAYDLYLRARHAELFARPRVMRSRPSGDSLRRAQALYAQAKSLDPEFAPARARLALVHMTAAEAIDTSVTRREQARLEAESALRSDSLLAGAHEAMARYWLYSGDRARQIETLERAIRILPNNSELSAALAAAYVVTGRWEDGVRLYERAVKLDPRNPRILFMAATTLGRLRRQDLGMPAFDRFLEISPQDYEIRLIRGQSWLRWKGTADTLLAAARALPPGWDELGMATFARYTALRVQRRYREILQMLDQSRSDVSTDGLVYHTRSLMRAEAYHGLHDEVQAAHHYERARVELAKQLAVSPSNPAIHSALGLAYAGLGRKNEAIAAAERAMELMPFKANAIVGTAFMGMAVEIFARAGELDRAFEMIDLMLTMPSGREITIPYLRVWPGFDPLRGDPRFDAVIRRYAAMYPDAPR